MLYPLYSTFPLVPPSQLPPGSTDAAHPRRQTMCATSSGWCRSPRIKGLPGSSRSTASSPVLLRRWLPGPLGLCGLVGGATMQTQPSKLPARPVPSSPSLGGIRGYISTILVPLDDILSGMRMISVWRRFWVGGILPWSRRTRAPPLLHPRILEARGSLL